MTGNAGHFCAALPLSLPKSAARSRAALLNATFWGRDTELTVGFLGGTRALRKRVQDLAMEWLDRTGARLHFQFWLDEDVDAAKANIRVAFDPDKGSWSWVGTQARSIARGMPTMNLGWMTLDLEEARARSVVLHEFGHAIGLIHEHLHPFIDIQWNRERVIADMMRSQKWDEATVVSNMFDVPAADQVFATAPDPQSIMMYAIPPEWTMDGMTVGWNDSLSADDIRLIQEAYGVRTGWAG